MIYRGAGCPHPPPVDLPLKVFNLRLQNPRSRTNIHYRPSLIVVSPTFRHIFSNKPLGSVI